MKKENLTTETTTTTNQTPIEIALQIDENGMTTASNLYSFLELNPSNFSRWCNKNIVKNKFATENVDYFSFVIQEERNKHKNPKPKTDYKLTSEFAKKLSMTGNSEKHEQARNYFIACEQGLKVATKKLESTQNDIQLLVSSIVSLTQATVQLQKDVKELKQSSNPSPVVLPEKKYSRWKANTFDKLKLLMKYVNEHSEKNFSLSDVLHITINEMQDTYDVDLSDYTKEYMLIHSSEVKPYDLDVISYYKEIKALYNQVINSIMDKLQINTKHLKQNIFDELANNL